MKHVAFLSDIEIPANRQRRDFDPTALNELADSIERLGLMHPPVMRKVGDQLTLVAGERRFRAISDLHDLGRSFQFEGQVVEPSTIPYTLLGELTAVEAMEAELEENIRRVDLSWQEKAIATDKLEKLRSAQAAQSGKPAPTTADIALEVRGSSEGAYQEATRKELILAKHMEDPDVKSAKSIKDAFKILQRKEEAAKHAQLAEVVGKTLTTDDHVCHHADSLEWLTQQPSGQYDVILTDPPYGMGADEFGDSGGQTGGAHFYSDTEANALRCYSALATEGLRITKPQAHLYAFCDIDLFPKLKTLFAEAGWRVFRTPLIWYKPAAFRAPWPEHGPQRKYECILYAIKGDRKVNALAPDVIECPPDKNIGHNAQKPVALYKELLRRSARPGDRVLDPFCGSGPIFPAAHASRLLATGVELDPTAYGLSLKRIQELVPSDQGELPV